MLTIESLNPDHRLAVTIAIFFAEDALPAFEKQYPKDMRPRRAVEAAKAWLTNPCEETADDANAAALGAYTASASASDTASAALAAGYTGAAASAANAAASAFNAAYTAANPTANAADAANAAADYAWCAIDTLYDEGSYIHSKLVQLLPHLFEYKVYAKTSFKDSGQVFDLLSKKNQQRFLFNLDHLV